MRRMVVVVGCFGLVACGSSTAPRPPAQLAFVVQPSSAVAGLVMATTVEVAIEDASGKVVTTATGTVTLGLAPNPSGGKLSGIVTASAVKGVASFPSLVIDKVARSYTLQATTGTFAAARSAAFAVTPGAVDQLAFTVEPPVAVSGQVIAPAVQVTALDAEGNVATGFTDVVNVMLGNNPAGGTLSGASTTAAVGGVATFPNLVITGPGTGYSLVAVASGSVPQATSLPFIVDVTGGTGIDYFGGPVIYTPKVAALYWSNGIIFNGGPPPGTFGSPARDQSLVAFFLRNVAGSPYFNITATYGDATMLFVQNAVSYSQYWADSVRPTTNAPTDSAVQAEVEKGFTSGALAYDSSTLYAVFSGPGVNLGGGFGSAYCAYHSFFIDGLGRTVKYAVMPYDDDYRITATAAGCSLVNYAGSPNSDPAADAELNVFAHEVAETVTDEYGNAWYVVLAGTGYEMADLCAWNFGLVYATANGADANESLGGKDFLLQMLWVNAETAQSLPVGCQQGWATGALAGGRPYSAPRAAPEPRGLATAGRRVMRIYSPRSPGSPLGPPHTAAMRNAGPEGR